MSHFPGNVNLIFINDDASNTKCQEGAGTDAHSLGHYKPGPLIILTKDCPWSASGGVKFAALAAPNSGGQPSPVLRHNFFCQNRYRQSVILHSIIENIVADPECVDQDLRTC